MTNALQVIDLHVHFGGVRALDGVSFEVAAGQIVGFVGANGAGKTTLFDAISGFVRPTFGAIRLFDRDITSAPARARSVLGIGRGFQNADLFPALTVTEVLAVAAARHLQAQSAGRLQLLSVTRKRREVARRVEELVDTYGLGDYRNKFVSELSTGSRRIVELTALSAQRPEVLLLDEPSSGIAQREVEALGDVIRTLQTQLGCALLIIEHDIPLVSSIAPTLVAMNRGEVLTIGAPADVLTDDRVVAAYLGTNDAAVSRSGVAS